MSDKPNLNDESKTKLANELRTYIRSINDFFEIISKIKDNTVESYKKQIEYIESR